MSISTVITQLQTAKANIAQAIEDKGVDTTGHGLSDFADDIADIPTGGTDDRLEKILWEHSSAVEKGTDFDFSDLTNWTIVPRYRFRRQNNIHDIADCPIIKNLILPDSITAIEDTAFYNQFNLRITKWPASLTSIANYAFSGCTALDTFPENITTVGPYAFEKSGLTKLEIPATVTTLGQRAFQLCIYLEKIKFKNTTILSGTCNSCTLLSKVWISSNVTTIEASSFSVAPFYKCSNLTTIYCEAAEAQPGWGAYWNQASGGLATVHYGVSEAEFDEIVGA